jgi:hypothetical protein
MPGLYDSNGISTLLYQDLELPDPLFHIKPCILYCFIMDKSILSDYSISIFLKTKDYIYLNRGMSVRTKIKIKK